MSLASDSTNPVSDGLFARARAGDQSAWEALFAACHDKVLRVVRRRLNPPMRSLYDSTDFVSDVWKSLAAKVDRLDFPTVNHLIAFLVQAVDQKIKDEYRRQHAQKRDIDRNRCLGDRDGDRTGPVDLPSPDPTPSQVAVAKETRERLLANQTAPVREVIDLKFQGSTNEEVAERTGLQVRKVQRVLKGLREAFASGGRR
jgi:RNA polymerase sigma factor (sigma-70 family)